jgi:energy-converting hydrogenase Eha subunit C
MATNPLSVSQSLIAHLCIWLAICLALAGISHLVPDALFFRGTPPVPLRANPILLTVGITLVPICLLMLYVADRYSSISKIALGIGALCTVLLCLGAILTSLFPGPGSLLGRDLVQQPEVHPNSSVFAFPVFFRNGESKLTYEEARRLEDAFAVFRSCEVGTLRVRGFASSKAFVINSNMLNLKLANDRAQTVKRALTNLFDGSAVVFEWDSYENMIGARRLRDTTLDGRLIAQTEGYNRRAEIFWSDSMCLKIEMNMLSPPSASASAAPSPALAMPAKN